MAFYDTANRRLCVVKRFIFTDDPVAIPYLQETRGPLVVRQPATWWSSVGCRYRSTGVLHIVLLSVLCRHAAGRRDGGPKADH